MEFVFHFVAVGNQTKLFTDLVAGKGESACPAGGLGVQFPLDPHKESSLFRIGVLFQINDVAVMAHQEVGHGADNTLLVGARDQ